MSAADQNEINFQKRAMQKAYYNPMQHFQNYFQNENGFCYDMAPSYGQQNATDYYGSSCVLQSHMSAGGEPAAGQEYGNTYCMQTSGLTCNPGVASVNPNPSILKQQEIYPWMKESRQNSKQRQATNLSECEQPAKRARTAYTSAQLVELEKEFHFNRYLCRPRRIEMAALLNLTERQIKIWFQNRRMKYKKEQKQKNVDKQGKLDGSNPGSDTDSQGSMKSMTLPNNEQTLKSMSDALESFRQRSSPSPRRNVPTTPEVFPSPNSNSTNSLPPPPPPPQNACLPVVGGGGSSTCAISSDRPPLSYAPQSTSPGYPQMLPHHSNQSYMSSLLEDTTFHLVHSSPGTPCLRNDPRQDSYTYIPKLTHL